MGNVIARVGVYGDIHLSSKDYGSHRDYPKESLAYFKKITDITREKQLTHLVGLGDFTFSRFHTLEYRLAVEQQLEEQYNLTNGNRYELKGNHDSATYGKTERDFYVEKGLLKPSTNLTLGNLRITMVDYGCANQTEANIVDDQNTCNFIFAHDYYKFANSRLPNFGKAIDIDTFDKWYGADCILCGHIHKILDFSGYIVKNVDGVDMAHECAVHYLGCMTRPAYKEGFLDEKGQVMVLTVYDDGQLDLDTVLIDLWPIEESFNIEEKKIEIEQKQEKANKVDISDVVKQLDSHERNVGNPEDIIKSLTDVDERYKNKAIELLREAMQ